MAVNMLKTADFERAVAEGVVLIDFFATWCGPCRMLSPSVHALAESFPEVKVYQVDVDQEPDLARRFRVMSIPTLVFLKDGQPVKTSVGLISKEELEDMMLEVLR